MSELFRQQLAATGLQDTAGLLRVATTTIKTLADQLTATLKPAAGEYRGVAATLTTETTKLLAAARQVEQHNARLMAREHSTRWGLMVMAALLIFLLGGLAGIVMEKHQTVDALANIGAQMERVQTSTPLPIAENSRKIGRSKQ